VDDSTSQTAPGKETYEAPELVRHGTVAELTEGGGPPILFVDGASVIVV
jgi:hypothetical protein